MSDLYVRLGSRDAKPNPDAFWSEKWGWLDEASFADLVAALRDHEGVEDIGWCFEHNSPTGDRLPAIDGVSRCHLALDEGLTVRECRFAPRLVVPLDSREET